MEHPEGRGQHAKTLLDYLAEAQGSFAGAPVNEVDAAVLTFAAYLYLERGFMKGFGPDERMPLPQAICGIPRDELFGPSTILRLDGDSFLPAFLQSRRFMELEVGHYVDDLAPEQEKQFCAVTFYLPDGSAFVAFRGSDNSLAGWKENFNLSFMEAVPSQLAAGSYIEEVARIHGGPLYLGGHSKGGNLAEYAALTCDEAIYQRIVSVYCLDGPGFAHLPSARMDTEMYAEKLHKIVPEGSVFGLMMESRPLESLQVVRSSGYLFGQHSSMRWTVEGAAFARAESLSTEATIIANTINAWASEHGPEERELFFNAIFEVLGSANARYWPDNDSPESRLTIALAAMQLPAEVRDTVLRMGLDVAAALGSETMRQARETMARQEG